MNTWWSYALLSSVFAALTAIFAKVGIKNVDPELATAIRTVVIVVMAWAIVLAKGAATGLSSLSRYSLAFLALSGLATGLSWLFYFRALSLGTASQVSLVDRSGLALTLLFAVAFLGESLSWRTSLGALLILAGTVVVVRG